MCGIVGIYDRTTSGRADPDNVRAMAQAVVHRGPDGTGVFESPSACPNVVLGVRRLRIIDLATGDQPIFNEDRSIALVFNGEISNYIELREELASRGHEFRTRSDTETIVHLYEDHGLELFPRLRGMYAFALWDGREDKLILAVDHVGIKPLYFAEQDGLVLFASEVKALLAGGWAGTVNQTVIDTYLSFGYMIGNETLFDGVRRLPPGHALVVRGSQSRLIRHWRPASASPGGQPTRRVDLENETHRRLSESVRMHIRSDVPVGLFLSGGIDSASLLALMSLWAPEPIETFSVGYRSGPLPTQSHDETADARRTADHFRSRHHEVLLSPEDWWTSLMGFAHAHDEPNADPAVVSLFALAREAAPHVKVILSGLGGDEVFGGYGFHRGFPARMRQADWLRRAVPSLTRYWSAGRIWDSAESIYPSLRRTRLLGALMAKLIEMRSLGLPRAEILERSWSHEGLVFSEHLRASLYSADTMNTWRESRHKEIAFAELLRPAHAEDPADLVQHLWLQVWLPGSGLQALDKVTMAHSLEARVPFFDRALMDLVLSFPPSLRLEGNKALLRRAMRNDLPDFVLRRPKRPFSTPIHGWFEHELAARVQAVLLDRHTLGRGWFRPDTVESIVRRHFGRQADHTELIFRLLVFELWQQAMIDPSPRAVTSPSRSET